MTAIRMGRLVLLLLTACATVPPGPATPRMANLRRAAALPWTDEGRCVVREASNRWPILAERCFHALDLDRVRFQDLTGRCAVAVGPAIAVGVGVCLLAALELATEAVIVFGTFVVAGEILAELEISERAASRAPVTRSPRVPEPRQGEGRQPEPAGRDWFPPLPPDPPPPPPDDESVCLPKRIAPKGGSAFHDTCANNVPFNAFRDADVLVNGKAFDALQPSTRTLWEVKTNDWARYNDFVFDIEFRRQVAELEREQLLAWACGYRFAVGVRSEAHRVALEEALPTLEGSVVVMWWC